MLVELLLLTLLAAQVSPSDAPPRIAAFLEHCETARRGAILQTEHRLRGLRNKQPQSPETARQIASLEQQLQFLESGKQLVIPPLSFPPQKGAVGRLQGLDCHVDQVVSRDEMLVRCFFKVPITTVRNFQRYRDQVTQSVPFLVRGLETGRISEGQDADLPGVFEVIGTESYRTEAGGSRDVTVLIPFDMAAVDAFRSRSAD